MKVVYIESCVECPFGFFNKINVLFLCKYNGRRYISVEKIGNDKKIYNDCPLNDYEESERESVGA